MHMRTRYTLFCFTWICVCMFIPNGLPAQNLLTGFHRPLTSDSLWIYKLPYQSVGDSGQYRVWDFSTILSDSAETIRADYFAPRSNDTAHIGLHRERTNYYYHYKNDTLWMSGYENSRTHMHYSAHIPLLCFPFNYGDTLIGAIAGNGLYCHTIPFSVEGISRVHADAFGCLKLPDITIDSALRVHTQIQYESRMNKQLTWVKEERHLWYSTYCRYPLLETVSIQTITAKDTICFASSYYIPQEQDIDLIKEDSDSLTNNDSESIITNIRYLPNPVSTDLQIHYSLIQSAQVYISLHYNGGITTYQSPIRQEEEGDHILPVNMGGMPVGNYVVYIHADDTTVAGNIIKY